MRRIALLIVGVIVGQMVLYGASLLGRKVLLPLDLLSLPGMYLPETRETQKTVVHNPVLMDLVSYGEPDRRLFADELRVGRWPAWNPYQFAGAPVTAPRFSPFMFLLVCAKSPIIIAWVQVLIAEVAAIGFYVFCRKVLEIGFWPALVTAWCYPLTGFFVLWQGYGLPMTVCWLPWLLLATEHVVRGGSRWAWPVLAFLTGLVVVSGQTDVAGQVLLTAGFFALWRLVERNRQDPHFGHCGRTAIALATGWGVGFLVAASHLLPLLEYTHTGARMERRGTGEEERPPVGLAALPQAVVPHFYGSTENGDIPLFPAGQKYLQESSATTYAGLLATLFFAPLAFSARRRRWLNLFWLLLAFVALSWQLDIPGMVHLLRLPGLNMMSHNRFVFAAAFSILVMAARGLDLLGSGQWSCHWWMCIPVVLLVMLLSAAVLFAIVPPEPLGSQLDLAVSRGQSIGQITDVKSAEVVKGNFLRTYLITACLCLFALGGWLIVWRSRRFPRWFPMVAGSLMISELLWYGYGRAAQCDWSLYFPDIPVLKQVAQAAEADHGRVIGAGRLAVVPADVARKKGLAVVRGRPAEGDRVLALVTDYCLPAKLAQTLALRDVRGYDGVDPARFVTMLFAAADPHSLQFPHAKTQMMVPALLDRPDGDLRLHPILDMLSVRYVIFRGEPVAGIRSDFTGEDYWVHINRFALPRAFIPERVETIADATACLRRVSDTSFNPRRVAYDESEPATAFPPDCRGTAEITRETPTEICVSATMETAGMLVLADRWDQGWKAYVSTASDQTMTKALPSLRGGTPSPIRQVNYAVRGVELPPGKSEVVFRYEPASLTWGLRLSGLAIAILLAVTACSFRIGPLEGPRRWTFAPRAFAHASVEGEAP